MKKIAKKIGIFVVLILILVFVITRITSRSSAPTYQVASATKGTLISSVTASGIAVSTSNINVTSSANGQVAKVYIKEGDKVVKGQRLFDITLDSTGQQKAASAYSSYISAVGSLNSARANYYTLQAAAFSANQKFMNDAVARNLATNDPTYIQENATWLASQSNFDNAQNNINAAQANLTSTAITYQQSSSTITSPANGTIQNITIVSGMGLSGSTSSTIVATIKTDGNPVATVNIAEVDVAKVKSGQKVTLTFDSIPDATFTGKIAGVNKLGVVTSGVTNYPATIEFDSSSDKILPNMSVSASIIMSVKDSVIIVPSSSVVTQNGETVVRELKNGQLTFIPVTIGDKSDSETEIISGVNEGDSVVTAVINSSTSATSNTTSPFGSTRGGFGGGGATFFRSTGR